MFDKTMIRNISSLFSIRIASYLIPLITLPYLVRTLGVEGYGYYGFCLAITQYAILAINYGFDLTITRAVARFRRDKQKISELYWNVTTIKLVVWLFCFIMLVLFSNIFDRIEEVRYILFSFMLLALSSVLFPQWLFQGKEQLGHISLVRITMQILSLPLLFIFVKVETDIWKAAIISGCAPFCAAVYSLFLIKKRAWLFFNFPSLRMIKEQLLEGWHVFISTAAISLYTTSVTVILGFVTGPASVGYFVAADRIIKASLGLYGSISSAFYPRVNSLVDSNKIDAIKTIFNLSKVLISIAVISCVGLFLFSDYLVLLLFGSQHFIVADLLKILSVLPVFISLSNLAGVQVLIPFGYKREFSRVLVIAGCTSLVILVPAVSFYSEYGAAISVVFIEFLVSVMMIHRVFKFNLLKV